MEIPGLGLTVEDAELEWYRSVVPVPVPILGGALCHIVVEGYEDDPCSEEFHRAISTFLADDQSVLAAAAPAVFEYYRYIMDDVVTAGDDEYHVEIHGPDDVFDHVRLGNEPIVTRDPCDDRHVYVSLECECEWEPEHGLQIVFRDGGTVTKVGPCDGHLTNSAAYADDILEGVVYHRPG